MKRNAGKQFYVLKSRDGHYIIRSIFGARASCTKCSVGRLIDKVVKFRFLDQARDFLQTLPVDPLFRKEFEGATIEEVVCETRVKTKKVK
jgi:hypothetical protein